MPKHIFFNWMMFLLHKVIRRLHRKPQLRYLRIVEKKLDDPLPTCKALIPFEFKLLPPVVEEVEANLVHLPAEHRPDIAQRIQNGHYCGVAMHNGQIIFASWTAFGTCYSYFLGREYELSKTESYIYGAYTLPDFRGKRIHPASTCCRLQLLKEMGCKQVFAFIEPSNKAAHRMPERLGFCKVGVTGFIEVFGVRWYFHQDRGAFSALTKRNYWCKV